MQRDTALSLIRRHETELKEMGVISLSLFGSTARDEAREGSDIDVAVQLVNMASGLDMLDVLAAIKRRLVSILGAHVDVISEPRRPNRIKHAIEKDRQLAF